jgi:phosphatidylglycerophosphate synthase
MTTGWRLPEGPLRAGAIGVGAVGFLAVLALSLLAGMTLPLGSSYPLKTVAVFAAVTMVALGRLQPFHPFSRFGPANLVTTLRLAIVALIAGLIGESVTATIALGAAVASILVTTLDGADGWLARRSRMASAFGARFDMETDALLIMILSLLAWQLGKAGFWVLLAGLMRYLFVAAGWVDPRFERPLFPSRRRQAVCVLQILGLSAVVLPALEPPASAWLSMALVLVLAYSFAVDTIWLCRRE